MSYGITVSGKRSDIMPAARSQADAQRGSLSAKEQAQMDDALGHAEKVLNENTKEGDSGSISVSGSRGDGPTHFAFTSNIGISISRAEQGSATPLNAPGPTEPGVRKG